MQARIFKAGEAARFDRGNGATTTLMVGPERERLGIPIHSELRASLNQLAQELDIAQL